MSWGESGFSVFMALAWNQAVRDLFSEVSPNISTSVIGHAFAFCIEANFTRARPPGTKKRIALKATMTTEKILAFQICTG